MDAWQIARALRVENPEVHVQFQVRHLDLYFAGYPRLETQIEHNLEFLVNAVILHSPEFIASRVGMRVTIQNKFNEITDEDSPLKITLKAKVMQFLELIKRRPDYVMTEEERKEKVLRQTQVLKEELMKIAWAPQRLERWLNAGFDPDD